MKEIGLFPSINRLTEADDGHIPTIKTIICRCRGLWDMLEGKGTQKERLRWGVNEGFED